MARLFEDLDPRRIAERLDRVRQEIGDGPEILVAGKYVPIDEMGALAEAGVELVGENRLQDLEAKRERWGDAFAWDFIGNLQSRKVPAVVRSARLVHSVAGDSALRRLEGVADEPDLAGVLIQVNLSGEESKGGFRPERLGAAIEACPVPVSGLMTMPPAAADPEASRPYFARLAELAAEHGLHHLSMGTSQDYRVGAEEGATIVRLGSTILA